MTERVSTLPRQNLLKVLTRMCRAMCGSTICEAEFLVNWQKTAAVIVLDINNVFVNQFNHAEPAAREFEFYRTIPQDYEYAFGWT